MTAVSLQCARIARRAWLGGLASIIMSMSDAASGASAGAGGGGGGDSGARRVMVIGDSQAQGLAAGLQLVYRGDGTHRILDRSKIATGLTSWSGYDWPAAVHRLAATQQADVAVVMFGANDRPPVHLGGHVDPALLQTFEATYGARVRDIARTLTEARIAVIWVGHPIVRDPAYAADMVLLNGIFASNATAGGAVFVPLWATFLGPDRGYAAYGPGVDGQTVRLRADDGIHMTPAGYQVAARVLQPLIDAGPAVVTGPDAAAASPLPASKATP
jgi:hypothetical protein